MMFEIYFQKECYPHKSGSVMGTGTSYPKD